MHDLLLAMASHGLCTALVQRLLHFLASLPASARCLGAPELQALAVVQTSEECDQSMAKRQLIEFHVWTIVVALTDPALVRSEDVVEYGVKWGAASALRVRSGAVLRWWRHEVAHRAQLHRHLFSGHAPGRRHRPQVARHHGVAPHHPAGPFSSTSARPSGFAGG